VLFPERDFGDRAAAEFALREIAAPEGLLMSRFDPDPSLIGRTVAEIAATRGTDPATTLLDLIAEARALEGDSGEEVETVIGTSMDEADVERLLAWPHANVFTDGGLVDRHPRANPSDRRNPSASASAVARAASGLRRARRPWRRGA
jgi:N-acyl-D-amino-acid deacylase